MITIALFYINSTEKNTFSFCLGDSMRHFLPSLQSGEKGNALLHISSKHLLPVALKIVMNSYTLLSPRMEGSSSASKCNTSCILPP